MTIASNIDLLIEVAAVEGQLYSGLSPDFVAAKSTLGAAGVAVLSRKTVRCSKKAKSPRWSPKEEAFLEKHNGKKSLEEIAGALGRSVVGVRIRRKRDMQLPSPSRHPDIITAEQIANGLQTDSKTIHKLIDRGILEGYRLPLNRVIRAVGRKTLLRFIVDPMNWIYFKPERVGKAPRRAAGRYDAKFWAYARKLVMMRKKTWQDAWWRIGQVASYHDVDDRTINQAIRKGRIKAKDWGNWWILKSVATAPSLRFYTGKGRRGIEHLKLSQKAEAFLILAEAVGLTKYEVGRLMKIKEKTVQYLQYRLRRQKRINRIIKDYDLKVVYDRKTGQLYADWKKYRRRFPRLAKLMKSLKGNPLLTRSQKKYVKKIKRKAMMYKQARGT